jgi:Domain of Unknown Function (DUF1080)
MRITFKLTLIFMIVLSFGAKAQDHFYTLTPLPLNDLSSFKDPAANWSVAGKVSGTFDDVAIKSDKGSGVLVNKFSPKEKYKGDPNLFTTTEHGDIFLSLDFLLPKGSNSGIYLQGRYEIQLFDSWNAATPRPSDCGGIYERWDDARPEGKKGYEGHAPRLNACKAPNLWQHLEIEFRAPRFDPSGKKTSPAQFVSVRLNGALIHQNVYLSGPTRASAFNDEKATGPLLIQGDHGPVAFRNIKYAMLDDFAIKFKDLTYEYYEGDFNEFPKVQPSHLVRKGKAEAIDVKLADNPNKLCLVFTGKLDLTESNDYQFIIKKIGKAKLSIDGEEVIRSRDLFQDYEVTRKLSAGEHTIVFSYLKDFSWAPTGMGLYIGKRNSRPQAMSTAASLPPLPPTPLIDVKSASHPELIRSFMEHGGKKKTHVISVGDPSHVNYAYDLKQAGILEVWKGDFLNATDMWYERGEPQVATAMGAPLLLPGRCALAFVAEAGTVLPDTLDDVKELVYKGYYLDGTRAPVFQYAYKGLGFEDAIRPLSGQGITRTLTFSGRPGETLLLRLGEGLQITQVSDNVYAVDDQRYYIKINPVGKIKPAIRTSGTHKELVLDVTNISSPVSYTLYW